MMLMGFGAVKAGSGLQKPLPPAGTQQRQIGGGGGHGAGSGIGPGGSGIGPSGGGGVDTTTYVPGPHTTGVYAPPSVTVQPPHFSRNGDCMTILGHGSPHQTQAMWLYWGNLVARVQQALNYIRVLPTPVAITSSWDYGTQYAWMAFQAKYGKRDRFTGKNLHVESQLTCTGLAVLAAAVRAQHFASFAVTPIDSGNYGGTATTIPAANGAVFHFEMRDGLWIVALADRPTLKSTLQSMLFGSETLVGGTTVARAVPTSVPIPHGQDAWTKVVTKLNNGFACLISTQVMLGGPFKLAFTQDPHVVFHRASTPGSLEAGAMQGFGQMPDIGQGGGGSGLDLSQVVIGGSGGDVAPDPATGLAPWALIFPGPKSVTDPARDLASGALASGGSGGTTTGGLPGGTTGGGVIPSGYPDDYGPPPPVAAPETAAGSPPWLLLGGLAAAGAAAYLLL